MSNPKRDKSITEIAGALGISDRMARKYASDIGIPSAGAANRPRYNLDEFRQKMREAGVQQTLASRSKKADLGDEPKDEDGEPITLAEANRRLTLERERTERIKNDMREGKLIDAEAAERAWAAELMGVRTAFEAVPVKAAQKIVAALQLPAEKIAAIREAVQAEVFNAMRGLST